MTAYVAVAKRMLEVLFLNPVFFIKRLFLQLRGLLIPIPRNRAVLQKNGVLFECDFTFSNRAKEMYLGIFQPSVAEVLERELRGGDTFIDIGANIGYFTAMAAGLVGESGHVHSFEPVEAYFKKLENVAKMNHHFSITVNHLALGEEEKSERIYVSGQSQIGDNSLLPELLDVTDAPFETVGVKRLDTYLQEKGVSNIRLIKIDVEGFEFPVLKGLSNFFSKAKEFKQLPVIICEVCPKAYPLLGHKLEDVFAYMETYSYRPFEVLNEDRAVLIKNIKKDQVTDVLFKPSYAN